MFRTFPNPGVRFTSSGSNHARTQATGRRNPAAFLFRKLRATEARADRLAAHAKKCHAQARAYWGEAQLAARCARDLESLARDAEGQSGSEFRDAIEEYRRKSGAELYAADIYDEMAGEQSADAHGSEKRAAEARQHAAAIRRRLFA